MRISNKRHYLLQCAAYVPIHLIRQFENGNRHYTEFVEKIFHWKVGMYRFVFSGNSKIEIGTIPISSHFRAVYRATF